MATNRFDKQGAIIRLARAYCPPHIEGALMGSVNAGVAAECPPTWGDRLLRRGAHVTRLEPMSQSKPMGFNNRLIDGELYTPDCRRGNIRATVIAGGRVKAPMGSVRRLHPFAKGTAGKYYPMKMYEPARGSGQAEEPNTEAQGQRATLASDY